MFVRGKCLAWPAAGLEPRPRPIGSRGLAQHVRSSVHMGYTNSDLKVNDLVRVGAHFVVEAEFIVACLLRRKDEIALSLLLAI